MAVYCSMLDKYLRIGFYLDFKPKLKARLFPQAYPTTSRPTYGLRSTTILVINTSGDDRVFIEHYINDLHEVGKESHSVSLR